MSQAAVRDHSGELDLDDRDPLYRVGVLCWDTSGPEECAGSPRGWCMMPVMVASVELGSRAFEALEEADSSKKDDICPVDVYRMGDDPHAFIQWKGTDVCADVYCSCGHAFHVDDDFVYAVKCPNCGKDWELEPLVRLVPQTGKCPWHEPKVVPLEGDRE